MKSAPSTVDTAALRAQLMAPDPMQRMIGLHTLEREAAQGEARLAGQVEAFASRGVPYYAPQDAHYQAWVGRALDFWQRLHAHA